jgi:hypothetical protein
VDDLEGRRGSGHGETVDPKNKFVKT